MTAPSSKNARVKTALQYALFIVLIVFIKSSVFGNYHVPTGSMNPTIIEGDRIFGNNCAFGLRVPFTKVYLVRWGSPARGDIVVFRYPLDESTDFTKRIIGLPGDSVQLREGRLYVNGAPVTRRRVGYEGGFAVFEESLDGSRYRIRLREGWGFRETTRVFRVPADSYFVLGDNRDDSADSRVWGFVPAENLVGRLGLRWMAFERDSLTPALGRIGFL